MASLNKAMRRATLLAQPEVLFSLVFMAVVWVQMAFTADAGTSVHHVILMWPFPVFLIAVAFTELSKRLGRFGKPVVAVTVGLMAAQNLLIYNTCLERLIRNGGAGFWTDAVYQLAGRLNQYRSSTIDVVDSGMMDSLRLLDRGLLRLDDVSFLLLQPEWGYEDRKTLATAISEPNHLFVNHIDGQEALRGVGSRVSKFAADAGYERSLVETITDRNGCPVFELFQFRAPRGSDLQAK